jgi:hypothetical protein
LIEFFANRFSEIRSYSFAMPPTLKALGEEIVPASTKVIVDNCGLIIPTP